jgi:hypothetical protein
MDTLNEQKLAHLIRSTRIAALATLHNGVPNLAMVAVAVEDDFSAFYIHVSRLGRHTRDMETDSRISLLLMETDDNRPDPQTLARLSLNGTADPLPRTDPHYERIRGLYLARFPEAGQFFRLGDFNLWRIRPREGRFVAGFAQAYHILPETLAKISAR